MALAPRVPTGNAKTDLRKKSSAHNADFKKEQRARNGTRSGSSGKGQAVRGLEKVDWDEVEGAVAHITDIAGKISHSQTGAGGTMSITMQIPMQYAHEALDAHLGSGDGMVFIRVYGVSFEAYLQATGVADPSTQDDDFDPFDLEL